jgi:PIN domain nuclease of toxin-antitoxin system
VVSLWEIEIKRGLGRIDVDTRELIREVSQTEGFRMLEVRPTHVLTLGTLPLLHEDPFDRMLIAQAVRDRLTLVSRDEAIHRYEVDVAW